MMSQAHKTRTGASAIAIAAALRPGDFGTIVHKHGTLYAAEYGLDGTFEAYVAEPLAAFVKVTPNAGCIWFAHHDGEFAGSIAIVRHEQGQGQLRWFLVDPAFRGVGLGSRLIAEAMAYCERQRLADVHLWTFEGLDAAGALYERQGFHVTKRKQEHAWGRQLTLVHMAMKRSV